MQNTGKECSILRALSYSTCLSIFKCKEAVMTLNVNLFLQNERDEEADRINAKRNAYESRKGNLNENS